MQQTKLHLGCGTKHINNYTNIDIRYQPGVDEVNNVKYLRNYRENTVDTIYACHVLEHFGRWEYKVALRRWFELLKPGGVLRISVPDFEKIVSVYTSTGSLSNIMGFLYGGQDYAENCHYSCWDFNSLAADLKECGFVSVDRYDWQTVEHSQVDDYSQAYIPHMDKENGLHMCLNVEAVK